MFGQSGVGLYPLACRVLTSPLCGAQISFDREMRRRLDSVKGRRMRAGRGLEHTGGVTQSGAPLFNGCSAPAEENG